MPRRSRLIAALAFGLFGMLAPHAEADDPRPLPAVPEDWAIELVAEAPAIRFPTAIVSGLDGTVYLGQDPMDMPGPPTEPIDSVAAIRPDGTITTFAEGLWAVMGLEWIDDALYVVHAPYLSRFRDLDGDGRADERVDLVNGLGPKVPGFSGLNDHVASGVELGIDGFLYISVGDKGIPEAIGLDGETITLHGGGVVRVRPDGSDLQVVSTGERNPLSAMLTANDELFTYGNDDDSKTWPNSLTHHIVGGHYGYPYEFVLEPERCLPIVAGQIGGSGTQGIIYKEDGLPERYRGNLLLCDWGLQRVDRVEVARQGATYRLVRREPFVTDGDVPDFRPFSIAPSADGASLYLVDWGIGNWLVSGSETGRLYRLWYRGVDAEGPAPVPERLGIAALDHPSHAVRLRAQHELAEAGESSVMPLLDHLQDTTGAAQGRLHALWALDAIGTPEVDGPIRALLGDIDPIVRMQAAKRAGIRRDDGSIAALFGRLDDPDAVVRRESAIAIGLIGDPDAEAPLMAHLGDPDPTVDWSIRASIRRIGAWDLGAITDALNDPARRRSALALTDEAYAVPVALALASAASDLDDPGARAEAVDNLAGILLAPPAWDGDWFGTNPLAGRLPRKTEPWDRDGMRAALRGLLEALDDEDANVRGRAIVGVRTAGQVVAPYLRERLDRESSPENLRALALVLGDLSDPASAPKLGRLAADSEAALPVRLAAVDALGNIPGPDALRASFAVAFDPVSPPEVVARVLPGLVALGALPPNDLSSFLDRPEADVRVAALAGLAGFDDLPDHLDDRVAGRLGDPDPAVRIAAAGAVAALGVRPAIPSLIRLADVDGDPALRLAAIRALSAMPDPRALPFYLEALGDRSPELRRSAESALLAIADRVRPQLEAAAGDGTLQGPPAASLQRILPRFRPIVDWKVIGPFARTTARVFMGEPSIDFRAEHNGVQGRTIVWQDRLGDPETGRVVIDDFKGGRGDLGGFGYDESGSPDLAAFAFARIDSENDREALLLIGSSGSLIVELNGEVVHTFNEYAGRSFEPDSDRVRVRLRSGSNRFLMRVRQGIGNWSFGVQVSEPSDVLRSTAPYADALAVLRDAGMERVGDADRGRALFFDPKGIGCVTCHAVGGEGSATIGPDLAGLASKYDRAEIVRSILEPSARIATGYQPLVVATLDGLVRSGLVREESAAELVLVDAEAHEIRVPTGQIEERRIGQTSIMPEGLAEVLSAEEFADLVAYLRSLDAPAIEPSSDRP